MTRSAAENRRRRETRGFVTLTGTPLPVVTSNDDAAGAAAADKGGKGKKSKLSAMLADDDELQEQFDDLIEKRIARERRQNPGRRAEDKAVGDEERQELARLREEAQGREQADLEKKKEYEKALGLHTERFSTKETAWKTREQALIAELRKDRVRGQIISAATRAGAVDPDDLAALLEGRIHMGDDFKTVVRDLKDATRDALNAEGDPMSIDELVTDYLAKKPHLARPAEGEGSQARGGAGASSEGSARGGRGQAGTVTKLQAEFKAAKEAAEKNRTPAAMTKMRQAQRALESASKAA